MPNPEDTLFADVDLFADDDFKPARQNVIPPDYRNLSFPDDEMPVVETVVETETGPVPHTEPKPAQQPAQPPFERAKTLPDGSSYRIAKVDKGPARKWMAEVKPVEGNSQYFYGETKDDCFEEVVKAQTHASVLIRKQGQQLKARPSEPAQPVQKTGRDLTAEERAHANQLAANGDIVAAQEYIQEIESGLSKAERRARESAAEEKNATINVQGESARFIEARPKYFGSNDNYFLLVNWLHEKKFGQPIQPTADGIGDGVARLYYGGHYTAQNLCAAFDALDARGLLDREPNSNPAPVEPPVPARIEPTVPPAPPAAAPVAQVRRPTKVTGIRPSQSSSGPTAAPVPEPDDVANQFEELASKDPEVAATYVYGKGGFLERLRDGQ
jgi:hypothetical protein